MHSQATVKESKIKTLLALTNPVVPSRNRKPQYNLPSTLYHWPHQTLARIQIDETITSR